MSDPEPERGALSPDGTHYYDGAGWGWQPLWLTPDRLVRFCREEWGLPVRRASLLAEGMLNQTWKLHCVDHDRVLRVGRAERTADQVEYEYVVARAWAEVTPVLIAPERDEVAVLDGHTLAVFPFVQGVSGVTVASLVRCWEIIPVLAALHRCSLGLGLGQRPGFRSIDDHPPWFDWAQVRIAIMDRYGRGPEVLAPIGVVDRVIEEQDRLLGAWSRSGRLDVRAPVHGDLNPRNQLYRDDRLVGLIDTDDLRVEPLVWEVAGQAYTDARVDPRRVWRDYLDAGGPLDPRDEELLLPFVRMGQLGEIQWLTDEDGTATHLALGNLKHLAKVLQEPPVRDF
ncbi:phosphotransferase enzyme family protein [Microlunatus parietis]|uniref:Ser/Thr protein kinase RdoA (MazF antagonist) n=1 Tax=Microlunatus parietis TaxID=682979 RepID=A0A7Y9IAZ3_9ACTN|nr:phosphotransferase [Microlunatus parietis]NYE73497.1 Ser/Thr protein kinase RdoA (MazF antagonist) [Microlunatus parietis]